MARRREVEGDIVMGWADRKRPVPGQRKDEQGRVQLTQTPYWELQGLITPSDLRYTVQHLGIPDPVYPDDWSAGVTGYVERPLSLTLEDLKSMPTRTVRVLTECAGNDMAYFEFDRNGGERPDRFNFETMGAGLVSGGEFTGVPLHLVLEKAGITREAVSVRVQGFDRGAPQPVPGARTVPEVMNYDKALPLEKALDPDTILAWGLNGEYLMHIHGAPVRLVVPGWTGNWWIKWVDEIEVCADVPWVYYQSEYYYRSESPEDPDRSVIYELGVKSVIVDPQEVDSPLPQGEYAIRGLAWSGKGEVTRVEVSTDGGETWNDAALGEPGEKWLWNHFVYVWNADKPGRHTLLSRAHDLTGRVQVAKTRWNHLMKNHDGIVPVEIEIA